VPSRDGDARRRPPQMRPRIEGVLTRRRNSFRSRLVTIRRSAQYESDAEASGTIAQKVERCGTPLDERDATDSAGKARYPCEAKRAD
jgi:hypothetical protein